MLRTEQPGRATRQVAWQHYAQGRGPRCTPNQLQCHRAAGPSDQQTDDADTCQSSLRPSTPGVCSLIHEENAETTLEDRTRSAGVYYTPLDQTVIGQLGPCHPSVATRTCSHTCFGTLQGREERRWPLTNDIKLMEG
jgi:hypothetical protein